MANIQALRPYQQAARDSIHAQWEQGRLRTLLVLPTGTGKTIVFASVAADQVRAGDRVLILAHRGELLEQAADKLQRSTGLVSAVEKAESTCLNSWFRVVVGSVQTLQRPARLERFPRDYFGTIIIDEAHHAITDGYRRILDYFEGAKVLGVTATPDRGDMRNLGEVFDSLAYEYKLTDAIKEGYLCKIMAQTIPLQLDISGVALSGGDYAVGELGTALDPYLEQIAAEMVQRCRDRKTVVFLPLIKTSQKFRDLLNAKGFHAAEVNGQSADRKEVLADFDAGKYNVLCNSMLLTEGWDCPSVDCVVVLRPTKVRSLYSQMVGRGTRLAEGKTDLLLLDFLWMTDKHELCRPADLVCEDRAVARQMTENLAETGVPEDIEEAAAQACEDVVAQREEALAKQLAEQRRKKAKLVDPLQYEMSIQAEDLSGYVPAFGWEAGPPTEQQTSALEKLGILPDAVESAGKASLLLDRLHKRRDEGLTTPKQIRCLEKYGFQHVGTWSFEQAKHMIDRIAAQAHVTRTVDLDDLLDHLFSLDAVARLDDHHAWNETHQPDIFDALMACAVLTDRQSGMRSADLDIEMRITDRIADLLKCSSGCEHGKAGGKGDLAAGSQSGCHAHRLGDAHIEMALRTDLRCLSGFGAAGQIGIQHDDVRILLHQLGQCLTISDSRCTFAHSHLPPSSLIARS